jgi:hypothetical protein
MSKLIICDSKSKSSQIPAETYKMTLGNVHYKNSIVVEIAEPLVPAESPDASNLLTEVELTEASHALGANWYLFSEGIQSNFSKLPNFELLRDSNHTQFTIYHNEDLYLTFNRSLTTRDGSNISGKPYWNTSTATVKNKNSVVIGDTVHYRNNDSISGLTFSNDIDEAWCFPIHGKYIGTCFNGTAGIGDWKIYIK